MYRRPHFQQLLLAFVAGMLLFVQISGLHHHVHRESGLAAHSHLSDLHFGDAGLHGDEHHAAHSDAAAAHHAHGDVEVKALGDPLTKLSLDLLAIGLLAAVALLALLPACRIPRPQRPAEPLAIHPCILRPPANGPPARILLAF